MPTGVKDPNRPTTECPECGKPIAVSYIGTHRRTKHGVRQRASKNGAVTQPAKTKRQASKRLHVPGYTVLPFIVLQDENGDMWIAEKIR